MLEADNATRGLGIEVLHAAEGGARARMRVSAEMVNGHAIAHGGYVFMLADTTFACACNSHGPTTVAAGADITFVSPAHEGDLLHAEATERSLRGRSGIYDVTVRRGPEESAPVVAEFRGRSRCIDRQEGAGS